MPLTEENYFDYSLNDDPICPYCDEIIDISKWDLIYLYDDDKHLVECPYCDKTFQVDSSITWHFTSSIPDEDDLDGA